MGIFDAWDRRHGLSGSPTLTDPFAEWDRRHGLRPAEEDEDPGFLESLTRTGRALGSGLLSAASSVPALGEYLTELPIAPWNVAEALVPDSLDQGRSGVEPLTDAARRLRQSFQRGAAMFAPEPLPGTFGERLLGRPVGTLAEGLAGTAPQLAATVGAAYLSGGATAPLLVGGALEGLPAYTEARDAGINPELASLGATAQGAISGGLEALGAGAILNRIPGVGAATGRLGRALLGAGGEGITEVGQELVDVGRQRLQGMESGDVLDRLLAAGVLGAAAGGPLALAFGSGQQAPEAPAGPAPDELAGLREQLGQAEERRNAAERDARTDQLTGLMNRRAWEEARPEAEADPDAWVIAYDANSFGQVNKVAGHAAGDTALQEIGDAVRGTVAGLGRAYRLGGDEFVQVVRGDRETAEAVRQATEAAFGERAYAGSQVVSLSGTVGQTLEEADAVLQERKAARKGILAPPPSQQPLPSLGTAPVVARAHQGLPQIIELGRSEIDVEPQRFQFKETITPKGETGRLFAARKWDPEAAREVRVWRDPGDGRWKLVDGHQRIGLYDATGAQLPIRAQVLNVASPQEARALGALLNLKEGSGSAFDAARLFRDTGLEAESLASEGVALTEGLVRRGLALKELDPGVFTAAATGRIPEGTAVILGQELAGQPEHQRQLAGEVLEAAERGRPLRDEDVRTMARLAVGGGLYESGSQQIDLFGNAPQSSLLALQLDLYAGLRRELVATRKDFRSLASERLAGRAASEEIGTIDTTRGAARATTAAQDAELFERLGYRQPFSGMVTEAARRIANGEARSTVTADLRRAFGVTFDQLRRGQDPAGALAASLPGVEATLPVTQVELEVAGQGSLFGGSLANLSPFDTTIGRDERAAGAAGLPRTPLQLPEIVELSQRLLGGELPAVKRGLGEALGRFRANPLDPRIELRADLFKDPEQAAATLSHEIGHVVDWLPDQDLARGNILGRVATLKKHFADHLAALPETGGDALDRQARDALRRQVRARLGKGATAEQLKDAYRQALEDEMNQRGLITRDQVTAELVELSDAWRPGLKASDPKSQHGKYRRSSKELYADAVSALFNAPAWAKQTAPRFFRSFEAYLNRKPAAQEAYFAVQDVAQMTPEQRIAHRDARMEASLEQGRVLRAKQLAETEAPAPITAGELATDLSRMLLDRRASLDKLAKVAEKRGSQLGKQVKAIAESGDFVRSQVAGYLHGLDTQVIRPLEAADVDLKVFSRWLAYRRAAGERADFANPLGISGPAAAAQQAAIEEGLSPTQRAALLKGAQDFNAYRRRWVVDPLVATGALRPALAKKMQSNPEYVRFEVQDFIADEGLGRAAGLWSLRSQIGTLKGIGDPLVETMIHDAALIRMRQKAELATAAREWLRRDFPELIRPAEMRFSGQGLRPVEPKDPKLGLYTYLQQGQVRGVYLPKGLASSLETQHVEASAALRFWNKAVHAPIRALLVTRNPGWAVYNLPRDIMASAKNVYRGPGSLVRASKDALVAMGQVLRSGEARLPEEVELMRRGAVFAPGERAWDVEGLAEGEALKRVFAEYGVLTEERHRREVRSVLARWFDALTGRLGAAGERAVKVAAFRELERTKGERGLADWQVADLVRNRAGTPNPLNRGEGELARWVNAVFMFSNINLQGWRASWAAAQQDPGSYALKTVLYNVAPKMIQAAALYGMLDWLEDELGFKPSEAFANLSEYQLANFTNVPLWITPEGKTVALKIPHDYTGQAVSSLAWKIAKGSEPSDLMRWVDAQLPWGPGALHPALAAGLMTHTYAQGKNPYDPYRGQSVINEDVFRAGGMRSHLAFGKALWRELGGSVIWNPPTETADGARSWVEKATQFPLVGIVASRLVTVSDRGASERRREALEPLREAETKARLDRDDAIADALQKVNGGAVDAGTLYRELRAAGVDVGRFANFQTRIETIRTRLYGTSRERDLTFTRSKAERKALEGL